MAPKFKEAVVFLGAFIALIMPRVHGQAVMDQVYLWPNGVVPYSISSKYTASEADLIRQGLTEIETYSCIKFVTRTTQADYVLFDEYTHPTQQQGTCWAGKWGSAKVGNQKGQHIISLWRNQGCFKKFDIIHEMMHILGFIHEQSRGDRDGYIYVNENNVNKAFSEYLINKYNEGTGPEGQRIILGIIYLGTAYDTDSIMHYHPYAFAIDPTQPTLSPKNPCNKIGNEAQLSPTDAVRLNKLYKCPAGKPTPSAVVRNLSDRNSNCATQAQAGQCTSNPMYMNVFCAKACCDKVSGVCQDENGSCSYWAQIGECQKNPAYMLSYCKKSCGVCGDSACQDDNGSCSYWAQTGECQKNPAYMLTYCKKSCSVSGNTCKDDNEYCSYWAQTGECQKNPAYMLSYCKKSCSVC